MSGWGREVWPSIETGMHICMRVGCHLNVWVIGVVLQCKRVAEAGQE